MKFYERSNSLSVDCYWIALLMAMQPSHIILLLFKSKTSKLRLFSRLGARAFAPSSRIMQSLRCKFVKVSLSLMPLARASAPWTPMIFPSSSNLVRNFLFCRHFESYGILFSLMPKFCNVITLSVSLSIRPLAIHSNPLSFKGLLFRFILLSLYLLERTWPISLAPIDVMLLFSKYRLRSVSFSSRARASAMTPRSLILLFSKQIFLRESIISMHSAMASAPSSPMPFESQYNFERP